MLKDNDSKENSKTTENTLAVVTTLFNKAQLSKRNEQIATDVTDFVLNAYASRAPEKFKKELSRISTPKTEISLLILQAYKYVTLALDLYSSKADDFALKLSDYASTETSLVNMLNYFLNDTIRPAHSGQIIMPAEIIQTVLQKNLTNTNYASLCRNIALLYKGLVTQQYEVELQKARLRRLLRTSTKK